MKAMAVNGSPRKGWNTDLLLQEALKGAADAGAETELIQLSDLTFSGCRSCFACKKAGAETGRCMWKDDLQPVFDKMLSADAVFMGSPIYLGNVSGMMYCLMERLVFSLLSYDDYSKRLLEPPEAKDPYSSPFSDFRLSRLLSLRHLRISGLRLR